MKNFTRGASATLLSWFACELFDDIGTVSKASELTHVDAFLVLSFIISVFALGYLSNMNNDPK
jgi:preprotein translocase subunit SecG